MHKVHPLWVRSGRARGARRVRAAPSGSTVGSRPPRERARFVFRSLPSACAGRSPHFCTRDSWSHMSRATRARHTPQPITSTTCGTSRPIHHDPPPLPPPQVLQPQLPMEQLREVYSRICELLNTSVPKHFESVTPTTPAGQQRCARAARRATERGRALSFLINLSSCRIVKIRALKLAAGESAVATRSIATRRPVTVVARTALNFSLWTCLRARVRVRARVCVRASTFARPRSRVRVRVHTTAAVASAVASAVADGSALRVVDDVVHLAMVIGRLRAVTPSQLTFEDHFRKRFPSAS